MSRFPRDEVALEDDVATARWADESYALAPFVYSTPERMTPTDPYDRFAELYAQQRMALSAYRIAAWLEEEF
jgi:hypothetical protein